MVNLNVFLFFVLILQIIKHATNKEWPFFFLFFFMNYSLRTADAFPAVAVVD